MRRHVRSELNPVDILVSFGFALESPRERKRGERVIEESAWTRRVGTHRRYTLQLAIPWPDAEIGRAHV